MAEPRRRRRRRSGDGLLGLIVDLAALLPWWVGVGLAAVSWVGLRSVRVPTAAESAAAMASHDVSAGVTGIWLGVLVMVGQWVLPVALLLGAALSAWRRRQVRGLADGAARATTSQVLADGMTWREFERLVGEAFRRRGYRVEENDSAGPDGGIDLRLRRRGELFLVQCKQWRAYRVGIDVVQRHYGVMAAMGAAGGFVVTSGRFTDEARRFVEGTNIELVDGEALHAWLREGARERRGADAGGGGLMSANPVAAPSPAAQVVQAEAGAAAAPAAHAAAVLAGGALRNIATGNPVARDAPNSESPTCPRCGAGMVLRRARRGAAAGGDFWGCGRFPGCRGSRGYDQ